MKWLPDDEEDLGLYLVVGVIVAAFVWEFLKDHIWFVVFLLVIAGGVYAAWRWYL